ncbi:MAG TPA: YdeI/OmpD-associated family protein [Phycisphaerae bacterium]|nr:YdeI/OmpD-associated family protein [Phycisphaerae bacterium]
MDRPSFFKTPAAFRAWLKKRHKTKDELLVGYYKKHTGKPSMTWPESVAEALCFGWIDGIRRSIDDTSYMIRFTPRRKTSRWSAVNVRMMAELEAAGKMTAAGRAIFQARKDPADAGYATKHHDAEFDKPRIAAFRKHKAAWKFFHAQPPGYQRRIRHWIMSAKRDETRDKRLATLIEKSAAGERLF